MPIPNFLGFVLENITAANGRKKELKDAFAKQVGWTEKVLNEEGEEIDNPVSFKKAFNSGVWEYIRQTCVAGMQKIRKEAAEADDTFNDLLNNQ